MIDKEFFDQISEELKNSDSENNINTFLRERTKREYSVCCGAAGSALDIILFTTGICKTDAVFVSAIAPLFVISSLLKTGAHIVFCDITNENPGINYEQLEKKVKEVLANGFYEPRMVIMSDSLGFIPRVADIERVCSVYGLVLVEDASEGFGGSFDGRSAGAFGDISIVAFKNRLWNTFGGAAILTDNEELNFKFSTAVNGGIPVDSEEGLMVLEGWSSKMNPVDAALIESGIEDFDLRKDELMQTTIRLLNIVTGLGVSFKFSAKYSPSWAECTIITKNPEKKKAAIKRLSEKGFIAEPLYPDIPTFLHPAVPKLFKKNSGGCPYAQQLWGKLIIVK